MIGWKTRSTLRKSQVGRDSSIYVGKRLRVATLRDAKIEIRYPKRFEDGPQTNKSSPFPLVYSVPVLPLFRSVWRGAFTSFPSRMERREIQKHEARYRGHPLPSSRLDRSCQDNSKGHCLSSSGSRSRGYQTTNSFSPRFEIQLINSSLINPPFEFLPRVE